MRNNFVKYWSCLLALTASVGLSSAVSYAQQDQIPSISIPRSSEQQGSVRPLTLRQAPTFNFDNPYLNNALQLEYQINLLQSMIERQSNLARLEKTYLELGSIFPTPDPPRGICEQIPVNVPCYKAYPELYGDVVPEIEQLDIDDIEAAIQPLVEPIQEEIFTPTVVDLADLGPPPPSMDYRWADISCAGGQCSAVIVEEDRERSRRTILEGDLLKGGVRVAEISARGVSLEYEGEIVALDPSAVPDRGGVGSPLMGTLAGGFGDNAPPEFEEAGGHNPFGQDLSQFTGVGGGGGVQSDGVDEVDVSDVVAEVAETEPPITDPGPPSTGLF